MITKKSWTEQTKTRQTHSYALDPQFESNERSPEECLRQAQFAFEAGELSTAQAAFSRFKSQTESQVFEWARRRPVPGSEPLDAVQATYTNAWAGLLTYDSNKPVKPWLATVFRNAATDLYRQQKRQSFVSGLEGSLDQFPTRSTGFAWDLLDLPVHLARLTQNERDAIECRYLKGFTVSETAEVLGVPMGTVAGRVHRALIKMRAAA